MPGPHGRAPTRNGVARRPRRCSDHRSCVRCTPLAPPARAAGQDRTEPGRARLPPAPEPPGRGRHRDRRPPRRGHVCTLAAHRRRGHGTALTLAALHAVRAVGAAVAVLRPSPASAPVYRRLGFHPCGRFTEHPLVL
ncbi:GNAT family N-acetyltransferase [Streptomyces noursei]